MGAAASFAPLIQSWISSVSLAGLFGLALRHWLASRKLTLEEREAARLGYGRLIEALEADVRAVRDELAASKAEHAGCEAGMESLRAEITQLHRLLVTLSLQHGFPLDDFPAKVTAKPG